MIIIHSWELKSRSHVTCRFSLLVSGIQMSLVFSVLPCPWLPGLHIQPHLLLSQFQVCTPIMSLGCDTGNVVSSLHSHCLVLLNTFGWSLRPETLRHIKMRVPLSQFSQSLRLGCSPSLLCHVWKMMRFQLHWLKDFVLFSAHTGSPQGVRLACIKIYWKTACHVTMPAPPHEPCWPHLDCIKKPQGVTETHQQGLCMTLCGVPTMPESPDDILRTYPCH